MIWNFCIRRPVFTVVMFLVIAIFGFYGYYQMPVREYPDVDIPVVSVSVVLIGADPEVIETEILVPLEEEIGTVEGLRTLRSVAREQVGIVTAEFELWRNIDLAAQDVRDAVSRARRRIASEAEEPIVVKVDPDVFPIMWLTLQGDHRWNTLSMSGYAEYLKEQLESLRGVGRVIIGGEQRYAMRIIVDPEKLAAHYLTIQDVVNTVRANSIDIPGGRIEGVRREFLVKVHGRIRETEELKNLVIIDRGDSPVRISHVAQVEDSVENKRQFARFRGEPTVGLGVVRHADAHIVELAREVRLRMAALEENFPPGLTYAIATDESEFIVANIRDLIITILMAAVIVVIVVMLLLRNAWSTTITGLAIPTSLLAGLATMYVFGFSVNTLTMLGLILAIGIVVDDAIVVVESCYRQVEHGEEAKLAAMVGTAEVAFPTIANTLSLAAVFIPVAFTGGIIGQYFFEFGLTVVVTVCASTFTALTLSPMISSLVLKVPEKRSRIFQWSELIFRWIESAYSMILASGFRHRFLTVLLGLGAFFLGLFLFTRLSTEFAPVADTGQFVISFETPEGATLPETDAFAKQIEHVLDKTPEVDYYFLAVGLAARGAGPGRVSRGISFVRLKPHGERDRSQSEVVSELRSRLREIPAGRAFVIEGAAGPVGVQEPIQLVLQHPDLEKLASVQEEVMGWMARQPEFIGIRSNLRMNRPQVTIRIDRDKASQMGIYVADISNTLRFLLSETEISKIEREFRLYDIITEITHRGRMVPDGVRDIYVRTADEQLVSLDNLIEIMEAIGPSEINRYERLRAATISASNPPGAALGDSLALLRAKLPELLPADVTYTFTGQAKEFEEAFYYLKIAIVFAVVFIFLVLAAQFESFLHPFTILLSLPLTLAGAFGALWIFRMPFGIEAFIGLIMLMGMATKNAILLVDYSNVLRVRGQGLFEAVQSAAGIRFRPVMMTTMSTVLGISPIAFGFGVGGEVRMPMGVAVVFGLLVATLLTLVVIPVVYTLVDQLHDRIWHYMPFGRKRKIEKT
ncbi:MAG: efflux RND transporter permease subunit [Candidatus Loosdrechtia sp.]|uniref:efflux RND transporter permease subunit n=1 Tax=Candidatus Loosdrechtia sp. TaxID=3101272 RepID=UPI003A6263A9|nr:MAG: efflux RND transporter permease subunit [Candidatus Jettenia sp. AMX2]